MLKYHQHLSSQGQMTKEFLLQKFAVTKKEHDKLQTSHIRYTIKKNELKVCK